MTSLALPSPPASPSPIGVAELRALLTSGEEFALIDARETGVYAAGHILWAVSMPLSLLEFRIATLVPRRGTRIVVTDADGSGLATRAARRLGELGYGDTAVLKGGNAAWEAEGNLLYSGINVVSKAFGEFVEHAYDTPRLTVAALRTKLAAGEDVVILDGRTPQEFANFSLPGALSCPNAELPYRIHDLLRTPEAQVVVNYAGRPRSIIGAQTLINAGLPNPVLALENGTMAWLLDGHDLEHGRTDHAPAPSPAGLAKARESVARLTERFGIRRIDAATLDRFVAESGTRSLHLLDVRTLEEYKAGHIPGSLPAPGGQAVQATDEYVGTRNGRIVLLDGPDAVRATITASWLIQIGWGEVHVLADAFADRPLESGKPHPVILGDPGPVASVTATELRGLLDRGEAQGEVTIADLASSLVHGEGHIPGAWFAVRANLAATAGRLPGNGTVVLTSPDGELARFAVRELAGATARPVRTLEGGTVAWAAAGLPLETGEANRLDDTNDVWRSPYKLQERGDREAAFREYMRWETDLIRQLGRDDTVSFKRYA
ncbi:rhodanese-related sulfurtransferase [Azospirillum agricola]|uniref:rhodanese-like domain-containing protein n=1 Tax=Azospirillum agricola TaxID=1720247 RepID=UPI001AE0E9DE|nr:rhodanese-like domain-containing protein [Azospirillum agricola]MBP2231849.1 rhodanese-related sulfurtransferase [Azospirillum agricola]